MGAVSLKPISLAVLILVAAVISQESGDTETESYEGDMESINDTVNNQDDDESTNESFNNETELIKTEKSISVETFNNETDINKTVKYLNNNTTEINSNDSDIKSGTSDSKYNFAKSNENKTEVNVSEIGPMNNETIDNKNKTEIKVEKDTEENDFSFTSETPNILMIMADDLGWNDVSYHGSNQILTPNIDTFAYLGVTIQNYYTDTFGTASRSAFFTGKYPSRIGTQGDSIRAFEDRGLPENEKLLPSYLQDLGYSTHLVGKWGLGNSRNRYLPTNRGFDTFFGFLGSSIDYMTYNHIEKWNNSEYFGLDLYNNSIPLEDKTGHLTEILTDRAVQLIKEQDSTTPFYLQLSHAAPHAGGALVNLQPPASAIHDNDHIALSTRRLYASLVTSLDNCIGRVVAALGERGLLQNTIIIIATDNGGAPVGPTQNFGSNLPLRGLKGTPWEGGVRSSAIVWHANIMSDLWDGLFHVTDWVPTIVAAAGGNVTESLDGVNQWDVIRNGEASKRKDVLLTIDDLNSWAAIREGQYKLIVGDIKPEFSSYYGQEFSAIRFEPASYKDVLFNCETAKVLKEKLGRDLNIHTVLLKRNDSILEQAKTEGDLCTPNADKGCLFNLIEDPQEANDLWDESPELVRRLTLKLRSIWTELKPRSPTSPDDRANPAYRNYTWSPWLKNEEPEPESLTTRPTFPLKVSKGELQYVVDLNLNTFRDKIYAYIQNMGDSFVKSVGGLFNFN